jgi:hypothetical protein
MAPKSDPPTSSLIDEVTWKKPSEKKPVPFELSDWFEKMPPERQFLVIEWIDDTGTPIDFSVHKAACFSKAKQTLKHSIGKQLGDYGDNAKLEGILIKILGEFRFEHAENYIV